MRGLNAEIFLHLEIAFAQFDVQLIDMKLEYGIIEGTVYLIDEITGGSFRLWPYAHKNPDFSQSNVLKELNPDGRLDKDTYRMGEKIDNVLTKFEEIAKITAKFKDLY
jgi:phosphoribosylaminoimidazole-succinocarboxamide synthase